MGLFRRKQSSSGSADFVDTAGKKPSSPNPESPVQIQTNNLCHNDYFKHSKAITDIGPLSVPPIPSSAKLFPTSQQPKSPLFLDAPTGLQQDIPGNDLLITISSILFEWLNLMAHQLLA